MNMRFGGVTKIQIITMLDFIQIAIDQHPVDDFRQVVIEYANLLNQEISEDVLLNHLKFVSVIVGYGRCARYVINGYEIINLAEQDFELHCPDSVYGRRIVTINDLTNLGLFYHL